MQWQAGAGNDDEKGAAPSAEDDGCKCRGVPEGLQRFCPPGALQSTPFLAAAASSVSVSSSTASAFVRLERA